MYYRRVFKAFTMDMARFETRNLYHHAFGTAIGHGPISNIVPTAIYDSDYVQSKWVFGTILRTTPAGVSGIDADNNLYAIDDRMMIENLKWYPYMHQLLISLKVTPLFATAPGGPTIPLLPVSRRCQYCWLAGPLRY